MEAQRKTEQVPDLTDFMNDKFFGTVNVESSKKVYNLTGEDGMNEDYDFESSTRSNSSRQTQKNGLKKPGAWRLHLLLALRHPLDLLGHQDL